MYPFLSTPTISSYPQITFCPPLSMHFLAAVDPCTLAQRDNIIPQPRKGEAQWPRVARGEPCRDRKHGKIINILICELVSLKYAGSVTVAILCPPFFRKVRETSERQALLKRIRRWWKYVKTPSLQKAKQETQNKKHSFPSCKRSKQSEGGLNGGKRRQRDDNMKEHSSAVMSPVKTDRGPEPEQWWNAEDGSPLAGQDSGQPRQPIGGPFDLHWKYYVSRRWDGFYFVSRVSSVILSISFHPCQMLPYRRGHRGAGSGCKKITNSFVSRPIALRPYQTGLLSKHCTKVVASTHENKYDMIDT